MVQQGRNFLQHAEDVDLPVDIVMRDNDGKYPAQFDEVLKSGGASIKRNTPWSPNLRAHVETSDPDAEAGSLGSLRDRG